MQETRSVTTSSGTPVRHPSGTPETVRKPKLLNRLHESLSFRHSFVTHLLEDRYNIWTVQELLGQEDVETTMIYTHVLNRGGRGVRSPMDAL